MTDKIPNDDAFSVRPDPIDEAFFKRLLDIRLENLADPDSKFDVWLKSLEEDQSLGIVAKSHPEDFPNTNIYLDAFEYAKGELPNENGKELLFEIEIPVDVSDEEALAKIEEMARLADQLHRSQGGSGLKLKDIEVSDQVASPEDVPNV